MSGGATPPPITEDGTGTLCQTDQDCPGDGKLTCINPEGTGGFCSKEGCAADPCQAPYVCCRECSELVSAFLPFMDSACFPGGQVEQLTRAPASCTCD